MILGLIIAGGRSERFGSDKALAPVDDRPMIARVAAVLQAACEAVSVNAPLDSAVADWATRAQPPDRCAGARRVTRPDRLIYMANQIGKFFAAQPGDGAAGVAGQMKSYWDPRKRGEILAWRAAGGEGLDPIALDAVGRLDTQPTAP